jgi:hypothetical protein
MAVLPGPTDDDRYRLLVARGLVRLNAVTTSNLDRLPRYDLPDGVSPLDLLLAERAEDDR